MKYFDRVKETSTTTGTGDFTLVGAATGFRAFSSVLSTNDTCYYCIALQGGSEWETGIGTYSATNTLTRTTVLASSNSGSAVNFSSGTKNVFMTVAADKFSRNKPSLALFPTWLNQGEATATDNIDGSMSLVVPAVSGDNIRARLKTVTGSTFSFGFDLTYPLVTNYSRIGAILRNSGDGKIIIACAGYPSGDQYRIEHWQSATAIQDAPWIVSASDKKVWFRFNIGASNLTFSYSFDGINYVPIYAESKTAWLSTIDQVGIFGYLNNGGTGLIAATTCFEYTEV